MVMTLILLGAAVVGIVYWFFFRIPRPKFPPLSVDKNNPLMIDAIRTAQENITVFGELFNQYPTNSQVKVPFKTSYGETEFLWAQVKQMNDSTITVFLLTPPVTPTGQVNRTQTYQLKEIIDWVVFQEDGKAKGGFTMKVMFKIAKEKWGKLPRELIDEEKKYQ